MIPKLLLTVILASSQPGFARCSEIAGAPLESVAYSESQCLKRVLHTFFLEDDFSYTLFGDKPMSFCGIDLPSPASEKQLSTSNPKLSLDVLKTWRKNLPNKNFFFVLNEDSDGILVYFINRSSFIKTVANNIDVFLHELGNDFTVELFLKEIRDEKKSLLDIIHFHEGILGILLGYGRHNAMLFQKKADLLGRCWAYGDQALKSVSTVSNPCAVFSRQEELAHLDSKLQCFSKKKEYNPTLPIAPLGFAADTRHPETKHLKRKYRSLQNKINRLFLKQDPLAVILETLMSESD